MLITEVKMLLIFVVTSLKNRLYYMLKISNLKHFKKLSENKKKYLYEILIEHFDCKYLCFQV